MNNRAPNVDRQSVLNLISAARAASHVLHMEAIRDNDAYWAPGGAGFVTQEVLINALIDIEGRVFAEHGPS
jgi:hypothetical protein